MEQVTPSTAPYSSFVTIHQSSNTNWVIPIVTIVLFVIAQIVTVVLYTKSRNKADNQRFDLALRELCGRFSAAASRLQRGRITDSAPLFEEVQTAWVDLEYVTTPAIYTAGMIVMSSAQVLTQILPDEASRRTAVKRLAESNVNFRDTVREHLKQVPLPRPFIPD